eukprot:jgi/Chrpa1/19890/Chrysochromulina_OHIO_Genome00003389-RA
MVRFSKQLQGSMFCEMHAGAEAQARERANKAQATADEQLKVAAKLVDEATVKSTELTRAAEAKAKALTADATSSLREYGTALNATLLTGQSSA